MKSIIGKIFVAIIILIILSFFLHRYSHQESTSEPVILLDPQTRLERAIRYQNGSEDYTPLELALHEGHPKIADLLKKYGENK